VSGQGREKGKRRRQRDCRSLMIVLDLFQLLHLRACNRLTEEICTEETRHKRSKRVSTPVKGTRKVDGNARRPGMEWIAVLTELVEVGDRRIVLVVREEQSDTQHVLILDKLQLDLLETQKIARARDKRKQKKAEQ
jgi:hypothetical protein